MAYFGATLGLSVAVVAQDAKRISPRCILGAIAGVHMPMIFSTALFSFLALTSMDFSIVVFYGMALHI